MRLLFETMEHYKVKRRFIVMLHKSTSQSVYSSFIQTLQNMKLMHTRKNL